MNIKKIQNLLDKNTCALITSDVNRLYLSSFRSSAGSVIITKSFAALLIDFRYFEKAKKTVNNMNVRLSKSFYTNIIDILKKEDIKNVLIETEYTSVAALNKLKASLKDFTVSESDVLSQKLTQLRQIKSTAEIEQIKKAQKITDSAFNHILNFIKAGITEKEIALELEFFMRKLGSEGTAFETITVSGKNSSMPHGVPTEKPLQNGDFLTMDFGAVCGGYCSDMTRTVAIGNAGEMQKNIYSIVLNAQLEALKSIKPNIKCKEIDKTARNIISNNGYGDCFGHSLGHSVGLEIHESPTFSINDETILSKGMVLTVEPGIYLPDKFGVRIEDMVIITDSGFENITKSPKNLITL